MSLDPGSQDEADLLRHGANVLRALARHIDSDLSFAAFESPLDHSSARDTLTLLAWHEPTPLPDLEQALGLSQSAAVRVVERLVEAGLVDRGRRGAGDRRVWLTLTASGRAAADALTSVASDPVMALVGRALPSARGRADFVRALDAIAREAVRVSPALEPARFCRTCAVQNCLAGGLPCPSAQACHERSEGLHP
ncbi:MAG: MarR family winged helix-turn-helix transcriptional regulator [Actinobacteria bacterium]|nr:MarR family winged helix-turn-helix transcriptional regulator [Actinomycetota bacterium]